MNKELIDLRKKDIDQLNAELISERESQFSLRIKLIDYFKQHPLKPKQELEQTQRQLVIAKVDLATIS